MGNNQVSGAKKSKTSKSIRASVRGCDDYPEWSAADQLLRFCSIVDSELAEEFLKQDEVQKMFKDEDQDIDDLLDLGQAIRDKELKDETVT